MCRLTIFALFTMLIAGGTAQAAENCLELHPGQGIGPVRLGMKLADLEKLGMGKLTSEAKGAFGVRVEVGPFTIRLDEAGQVRSIITELKPPVCLTVAGKSLRVTGPEEVAHAIGTCGPERMNIGANLFECDGVKVGFGGMPVGNNVVSLRVETVAKSTNDAICAGYLVPGELAVPNSLAAASRPEGTLAALAIQQGKNYCLMGRVVDRSLRPKDVWDKLHISTCEEKNVLGGTYVTCPYYGARFVFVDKQNELDRIEVIPIKPANAPGHGR